MKRFIALSVLMLLATPLLAVQPVSFYPMHESGYDLAQSSVTLSSTSVTTISAVSGWREVKIANSLNPATTVYYRIDGSTNDITTVGWLILPREKETIETKGTINLQLPAGASSIVVQQLIRRK